MKCNDRCGVVCLCCSTTVNKSDQTTTTQTWWSRITEFLAKAFKVKRLLLTIFFSINDHELKGKLPLSLTSLFHLAEPPNSFSRQCHIVFYKALNSAAYFIACTQTVPAGHSFCEHSEDRNEHFGKLLVEQLFRNFAPPVGKKVKPTFSGRSDVRRISFTTLFF